MTSSPQIDLSDDEIETLFTQLFPNGPAGLDVMNELAPDGWESSPLRAIYQPTIKGGKLGGIIRAALSRSRCRIPRLTTGTSGRVPESIIDPEVELRQLIGLALWDVFSNNHSVIAPDGRIANLGTFRGTASFIEAWVNESIGVQVYDYTFFYGGIGRGTKADYVDLTPVYSLIFGRLHRLGFQWQRDEDARCSAAILRAYANIYD